MKKGRKSQTKPQLSSSSAPAFFRPFSLDEEPLPVFPEPGAPRNSESRGLIDWFIRRELEEGGNTWSKKKPSYPSFMTCGMFPPHRDSLVLREHSATQMETQIGLHKMLSWIEKEQVENYPSPDVKALWELLDAAIRRLNRIAINRPELLRSFAERAHAWPIMYSDHKTVRQHNESLISKINLSKLHAFPCDKAARSDWGDELTKAASRLISYLGEANDSLRMMRSFDRTPGASKYAFDTATVPLWYMATADLEEFSQKSCSEWWKLGKQAFLQSYPEPENEIRFDNVKDTTPGRRSAKIIWLIGDRMVKLAKPL